ncbi:hypothetical protein ACFL37_02175 [Candidatus Margulisiibacteriota bacterium]
MADKKCVDCALKKQCQDSFAAWVFFVIGLVATVAIRVVTVLMAIDPFLGKLAWYVGVGGFFAFFVYKFNANRSLARLIDKEDLIKLAGEQKGFSGEQYGLISAILCNIRSEKERINYFFIFAVSAVALLIALYFDLFR